MADAYDPISWSGIRAEGAYWRGRGIQRDGLEPIKENCFKGS